MSSIRRHLAPSKRSKPKPTETTNQKARYVIDARESLVNDGATGLITEVSLPESMITSLRGILHDIDPMMFRKAAVPPNTRKDPAKFYTLFLHELLQHHPVLRRAEIRNSGTGLHAITWLLKPVEFETESDRQRWAAMVKVIQRVLPTDPDCVGITALTRPIGSINIKNNSPVTQLYKGEPVPVEEVIAFFEQARTSPFRTVATVLFGSEHVMPCPICEGPDSKLSALDRVGTCYGSCGRIGIGKLFDVFLRPRPTT